MSEKLDKIIEDLKSLTLLEASELVSEIEKVFGVDTSVSVAAVAAPVAGGDAGAAGGDSDQTEFEFLPSKQWTQKELLSEEFKSLGFYISDHPLNEYKDIFRSR